MPSDPGRGPNDHPDTVAEAMRYADPNAFGDFLAKLPRQNPAEHRAPPNLSEPGPTPLGEAEPVQEDEYNGHRIVIKGPHDITVDGIPLNIHVGVDPDGSVHTHGLPNYQFGSLKDMVRVLIESFPNEFKVGGPNGGQHGGHGPHGDHVPHGDQN